MSGYPHPHPKEIGLLECFPQRLPNRSDTYHPPGPNDWDLPRNSREVEEPQERLSDFSLATIIERLPEIYRLRISPC